MPRGRKPKTTATPEALAAEQTTPAAKTGTPKKGTELKGKKTIEESIVVQFLGIEWDVNTVKEQVIAAYVADGHRRGRISKLEIYLKPEEHKAYYVINEKNNGSIDIM